MIFHNWRQIADLVDRALAQPAEDREEWLQNACGQDRLLYHEVHNVLAQRSDAGPGLRPLAPLPSSTKPDARFGPWRIVRLLGQGGMGCVYEAVREGSFQQRVAIKLINIGFDADLGLRRFQRERRILARLDHPCIARLLDGGETETGRPWLAMEFVDGRPLPLAADALTVNEKLDLFRKILGAISYAHRNLIVHRDIKPSNILVTADGDPRLLDFGISRLLDDSDASSAATSVLLMTPAYASPEQVRGEAVGTASDIYSAGAVLYELLSGHRPHELSSSSAAVLFHQVCETEAPPPSRRADSSRKRDLTRDLDTICLKALAIDSSRRYLSADSFAEDIRRYREGLPIAARPDTLVYRWSKFVRRNRWQVAAAAALILTLLGGIAATTIQARISERRFQEGRRLAKTVLFDVYNDIETLPGSVRVRGKLVTAGMQYLDRLYPEAGNDPVLRLELAEAYEQIGNAQYFDFAGSLGRRSDAIRNWTRALEISTELRRQGDNPALLGVFARTNLRLAVSAIEGGWPASAIPRLNAALESGRKLAELMPHSPAASGGSLFGGESAGHRGAAFRESGGSGGTSSRCAGALARHSGFRCGSGPRSRVHERMLEAGIRSCRTGSAE